MRYEDGWFYGHTLVEDENGALRFRVEEAKAPNGLGPLDYRAGLGPGWTSEKVTVTPRRILCVPEL